MQILCHVLQLNAIRIDHRLASTKRVCEFVDTGKNSTFLDPLVASSWDGRPMASRCRSRRLAVIFQPHTVSKSGIR